MSVLESDVDYVSAEESFDSADCGSKEANATITLSTCLVPPMPQQQARKGDQSLTDFPHPLQLWVQPKPKLEGSNSGGPLGTTSHVSSKKKAPVHPMGESIPVTCRELEILRDSMRMDVADAVKSAFADALQAHTGGLHTAPQKIKETPNPSPSRKVKLLPVHRPQDANEFQALIRKHAAKLLQRDEPFTPFTNVPTKDDVQAFDATKGSSCCTADNFCLDFSDTPSSAWNKSASHVFALNFHEEHPGCQKSLKEVFNAFVVHFRYLCKVYGQQQAATLVAQDEIAHVTAGHPLSPPQDPIVETRRAHRHDERKSQV